MLQNKETMTMINTNGTSIDLIGIFKKNTLLVGFILIFVVLSIVSPVFLTIDNVFDILLQSSINGIIALGMAFVITTGGIDLSVGSIWALTGIAGGLCAKAGMPWQLCILLTLVVGALCGLCTGILVTYGRIQAFIATLAMMSIYRGFALIITKGYAVYGFPDAFRYVGSGRIFGVIPVPVVIMLVIFIVSIYLFNNTVVGRYLLAIGNNKEAARISGIKVNKLVIFSYIFSGVMCAIAGGIIAVGRLDAAEPIAGMGAELDAIAAVVIGGTALSGGQTKIKLTLLGALLLGTINNGLTLLGVATYYQTVFIGAIIVIAMLFEVGNVDNE